MDPISISFTVAGLFFGALQAAANISSACSAHRANQRRNENETGSAASASLQDLHLVPYNVQQVPAPVPSGRYGHIGHMVQHNPSPLRRRLGGWVYLENEQQSRDTLKDTKLGMHTGRMPGYNLEMAEKHWSHFQNGSIGVPGAIAVVNWSERLITMYEYFHPWKLYFRNYHVVLLEADLDAFAIHYYTRQVFSGVIRDSWLTAHNSYLRVVAKRWWRRIFSVKSNNSWSLLGIQGDIRGDLVFVEMKRAALFGIIECRFKDPTLLNVDMVGYKREQFVKVDTEYRNLESKGNSGFSVFSFSDNGWAEDSVLVG